jgi:DNA repair exonuclease SbcCD ATPase subunit
MRLNRVIAENYRQHRDLDVCLRGNLLGILGDNGKGKTHLLDAIQFGLCGKVPGQNKSAMPTWGETSSSVTVYFEHKNKACRIMRSASGSGASLHIADEPAVTGQKAVNARMEEFTGMDYDVSRQAVFVRQAEIDAILFTQPAERQAAWQRLCGLGEVPKIHTKLGQVINSYPEAQDLHTRIEEAKETLDSMQAEQKDLKAELDGMACDIDIQATYDQLCQLGRCKTLWAEVVEYADAVEQNAAELAKLPEASIDVPAMREYVKKLSDYIDDLRMQIVTAVSNINTAKRIEEAKDVCATAEQHIAESTALLEEERPRLLQLRKKEANSFVKLETLKKIYSIDGNTCPTCRQAVNEQIKSEAQEEAKMTQEVLHAAKIAGGLKQKVVTEAESVLYGAQRVLEDHKPFRDAESLSTATYVSRQQELQGAAEQANVTYETAKASLDSQAACSSRRTQLETLRDSALRKAIESQEKLKQLHEEIGVTDPSTLAEEIQRVKDQIGEAQVRQERRATLTGRLEQLESSISSMFGTLDVLTKEMNDQKAYREPMATLQRVRDWFHYANGPKKIINSLLEEKCARTNDFLEKFGSPFSVVPDWEEVSFRYYYHDGREVPEDLAPVKELSGGERVVLAVAFRFASYCMFAEQIGLLTLDEPTVYLDQHNIENFCTLMEKVRDVADKMDLQILISTHELKLLPFFSGAINLNEEALVADS